MFHRLRCPKLLRISVIAYCSCVLAYALFQCGRWYQDNFAWLEDAFPDAENDDPWSISREKARVVWRELFQRFIDLPHRALLTRFHASISSEVWSNVKHAELIFEKMVYFAVCTEIGRACIILRKSPC